jgi:SAM-dependent methyltransferase
MRETVTQCPLCGSSEKKLFDRRKFRDQPVTNQRCLACGLVYQSPRMDAAELEAFYQQEYRLLYQGSQGPSEKDLAVQRGRAQAWLDLMQAHLPRVTRHLDIGCSAGLLLDAFEGAYGCQAVGVEPGDAYREYAAGRGFAVYPSLEALQEAGEGRFDLISLAHVLEHIPNPVQYLASLRQNWLTEEGSLLVEVPNLYCHDSFEVAHLVAYSPHSLMQTLQQAGFGIVVLVQHGWPRSSILPLYLTVLARPDLRSTIGKVNAERWVAAKRRYGLLHRRLLTRLAPGRAWLPVEIQASSNQ